MVVSLLHEVMTKRHKMTVLHSSSACTYFNLDPKWNSSGLNYLFHPGCSLTTAIAFSSYCSKILLHLYSAQILCDFKVLLPRIKIS